MPLSGSLKNTRSMVLIAQFAALTAVFSQILIPLPFSPVAISLGTLAVYLAGGLLGAGRGSAAMLVYMLLGGFGLPVFAGLRGGPGALVGPTGGYIVGYVAVAGLTGLLARRLGHTLPAYVAGMLAGSLALYTLGTCWFMFLTGRGLLESLSMCVLPFLPGDGVKIAAAATLCRRLKRHIG